MSDQRPPTDRLQPQSNEKTAEHVGAPSTKREGEAERKKLPQLGALEDDDEFEVRSSFIAPIYIPIVADYTGLSSSWYV
jgi:hypothetical protein